MFMSVVGRELTEGWREGRIPVLGGLVVALALAALVAGWQQTASVQADRDAARALDRVNWETQGVRNPHSAAHFGQYAFRSFPALAVVDPGISQHAPTAIWLEAHRQNTGAHRPVEDATELGRFGEFSLAWVLQAVLPLVVLIMTAAAVAVPAVLAASAAAAGIVAVDPLPDTAWRALVMAFGYTACTATFIALGLAVSTRARSTRTALGMSLAIWVAMAILVPRFALDLGERLHPTPQPHEFHDAIAAEMARGPDGESPQPVRRERLLVELMDDYGVDAAEALPVSFPAMFLQAEEAWGNQVFDRHFGALWARYQAQERIHRGFALVSPLQALQRQSMGMAGTDLAHQRHFVMAAERHRREIVAMLNADMAEHGAGQAFGYQGDDALWRRIPGFQYRPPAARRPPPARPAPATRAMRWHLSRGLPVRWRCWSSSRGACG